MGLDLYPDGLTAGPPDKKMSIVSEKEQPLMKGPPSHTQTVTQTRVLSMWSFEP